MEAKIRRYGAVPASGYATKDVTPGAGDGLLPEPSAGELQESPSAEPEAKADGDTATAEDAAPATVAAKAAGARSGGR